MFSNDLFPQGYEKTGFRNLCIEMSLGAMDWEKAPNAKQRVLVSVETFRNPSSSAPGSLDDVMNYDRIHRYVVDNWPRRPHVELLETLADELVRVCFEDDRIQACRIHLAKPDVYADTDSAFVEVFRARHISLETT